MTLAARKIRLVMQLRSAGISDTAVLSAIERIPREAFVPDNFKDQAYENMALPIGHGQTLSQPQVVAMMTQALSADRRTKVLEIGTGSGYQAAVLSRICRRVYTIERYKELLSIAERRFQELRLHNITGRSGDGWLERVLGEHVPPAPPDVPARLADQVRDGGTMILPIGASGRDQRLIKICRDGTGRLSETDLGRVRFVPMVAGMPDGASAAGGPAGDLSAARGG